MTGSYKCASCSAPLDYDGAPMQKCRFCGSTNIAPPELFQARPADLSSLTGYARQVGEIQRLVRSGNKIEAIKLFRETFGSSLKDAKEAVEAMERGAPVELSAATVRRIDLSADPETKEAIKRVGFALGGSILATFVVVALILVLFLGGIFYFTWAAVERSGTPTSSPGAANGTGDPALMSEMLKMGGNGAGGGRFKDNRQVAVDTNGNIYSIDHSGAPMQVFDAEGKFRTQWPVTEGRVVKDVAADRRGNLVIVDTDGVKIYEGSTGQVVKKRDMSRVESVAVTADGRIVAAGSAGFTILDADLNVLTDLNKAAADAGAAGGFGEVAVNGLGNIFAVDDRKGDICKFSPEGRFLTRFPPGERAPYSLAVDPVGRIFAARVSAIDVFDENGMLLRSLPVTQAFGLAFDANGSLYVAARPFVIKYQLKF